MNKILINTLVLIVLLGFASCENSVLDVSDELNASVQEIIQKEQDALANIKAVSVDSIITNNPEIDVRGGKVEYHSATKYLQKGQWLGVQYSKATLSEYKIFVEIVSSSGSNGVYAYSYDEDYGAYTYVRHGNDESYISAEDLTSSEEEGYVGAYAFSAGQVTVKYYYERIESNGSGDNDSGFTADPIEVSPGTGVVNETNFYFKVRLNSGSANTATVNFYAPDGYHYEGFNMSKSGSTFSLNKKLTQVGKYYYRYIVNSNSQEFVSQWYSLTVTSNGATGSFSQSCIQKYYSSCTYARSQNAFYVTDTDLAGQCTWYAYGRVAELSDKGELPAGTKQKMIDAFWGKYNRHAKNWPGMMGGSWFNTNNAVLPANKRKKGMLAVWIFGNFGHVGFVEEISADGTKYRLSDFNRGNNIQKRDTWYSFTGTEDRLGGVYPRFLDLETL